MFRIDDSQVKRLERDLLTFAHKAYPFATKETLNGMAFQGQKLARANVKNQMITRNRWTEGSIKVEKSKTLILSQQASMLGSVEEYMRDQEFGAFQAKTGKEGVSIPTSFSSGEGENAQPRMKMPTTRHRMRNIRLSGKGRRTPKTRKQAVLFRVQDAVTSGRRLTFLDLGKRQGIFRVVGGSKKFKRGWPDGARLRMVYDMTHQSVFIPRNSWLEPASKAVDPRPIYLEAMRFQARRHGLFVRRG